MNIDMNPHIFYETTELFNNFKNRITIQINYLMPKFSMYENIISSYDKVLDDKLKLKNKNYIEIKEKIEHLKLDKLNKENILKKLEPLIIDFLDVYKKKDIELKHKFISQKAFIRIKEQEFKSYLISYELKLKEKEDLEEKKARIKSEVLALKNEISKKCKEYVDKVNLKNIEDLKSDIADISERFEKILPADTKINSDYINSEEYKNSLSEYKNAYNKLYLFMTSVFESTQTFINNLNFEKMLPELIEIQNKLKEKYIDIDKIDININKINEFINLRKSYEEALSRAKMELENINSLINRDKELLRIKAEIENIINHNQVV